MNRHLLTNQIRDVDSAVVTYSLIVVDSLFFCSSCTASSELPCDRGGAVLFALGLDVSARPRGHVQNLHPET